MAVRDSGISLDDSSSSDHFDSFQSPQKSPGKFTKVRKMAKQFENLTLAQQQKRHDKCNWWLDGEVEEGEKDKQMRLTGMFLEGERKSR
jgi:hypothetical protein